MIQPKDLRFTLTYDATSLVLTHTPDGWEETLVKWVRNEKYYGLFRSFSMPMRFVKEGASFICDAYLIGGVNAEISLLIETLDRSTWTYTTYYEGQLDLTKLKWSVAYIECNLISGGLSAILKAKENIDYIINSANSEIVDIGSVHHCFQIKEVFTTIINQMTYGGVDAATYGVTSNFLDNWTYPGGTVDDYMIITSGRMLRLSSSDAIRHFKLSLADFFQLVNTIEPVGIGIEVIGGIEHVRLEARSYFFDNLTEIEDIGAVRDLVIKPSEQYLVNKITVGWADKEIESLVSDLEFMTVSNFELPFTNVKNDLDLTTKVIGGALAIGDQEVKGGGVDEEIDGDNDIYIVHCFYDTSVFRPNGGDVGNPNHTSADFLNHHLSPKRCLLNHIQWIYSVALQINGASAYEIRFVSSKKNNEDNDVESDFDGSTTSEGTNITVTPGDYSPLFLPYVFEFECHAPQTFFDNWDQNPNGYIKFQWDGKDLYGFILEVGANPTRKRILNFTLLCTPSTDLVNYYAL